MVAQYQVQRKGGIDHTLVIVIVAVIGFFFMQFAPAVIMLLMSLFGGGAFLGYMWLFNPGEVHVLCPQDRTLRVSADGGDEQVCLPDKYVTVDLERGKHVVVIEDPTAGSSSQWPVDVGSGFFEVVAPASPEQCFVRMDVTRYVYPYMIQKGEPPPAPLVEDRYGSDEPIEVQSGTYIHDDLLPSSVESGTTVHLLDDVPCSMIDRSDADVLTYLGF